jgi:hypothetical protein
MLMPDDKKEPEPTETKEETKKEPVKEEQPTPTTTDSQTAGDAKEPPKPKTGIAAIAEKVEGEAKATTPTAGIVGDGAAQPPKTEEGKGLFFPDASKIKERAKLNASKKIPKTPETASQQTDTPVAAKPTEAEANVEPEAEEEAVLSDQRPPPPSVTPGKPTSPPQSHKQGKKGGIGTTTQVTGYITNSPQGKDGKPRFALVIDNLTKKDVDYVAFMCTYLADPERKYIPLAHPSYLVKFSLNFLLQAIKEEINETGG